MSCDQFQDQFVPYLLGELDATESHCVEQHLQLGCPNCSREFQHIREAVELMFAAVPKTRLSAEQIQRTAEQALAVRSPGFDRLTAAKQSNDANVAGALSPLRMLQALLVVAAGFFLMVGLQALQPSLSRSKLALRNQFSTDSAVARGNKTLEGDPEILPSSHAAVRFISLTPQKSRLSVHGYFLVDRFSREIHVIGRVDGLPGPGEQFALFVKTQQSETEFPMSLIANGQFKSVIPLPEWPIVDVAFRSLLPPQPSSKFQ